jgi:hypothetical protein
MLGGNLGNEPGIGTHRHDFLGVAHDAGIAGKPLPELVGLRQQAFWRKAEEGLLEPRPFLLDHAPGKARGKNPLRHVREHAVVGDLRQSLCALDFGQERNKFCVAALAFGGPRPNGREMLHGMPRFCGTNHHPPLMISPP